MKKIALFIIAVLVIIVSCKKDGDSTDTEFVSKTSEKKVVLVEEFTGVKCGFCPDGAVVIADMIANNPEKVIAIGLHGAAYNTPYAGDPDLTSSWTQAIVTFAQNTGWPGAMISRRDHDNDGKLSLGRGSWPSAAAPIMNEAAPVNIGIKSTVEGSVATITVQLYYTADGGGSNLLNVAITESGIVTQQAGATGPYTHKHVLREFLTGQWGVDVSTTTSGTLKTFTYTYTLKTGEVAANCNVVAFVTKSDHTEVLNVDETHMVGGVQD